MITRVPLLLSWLVMGSIFIHLDFCYGMANDFLTHSQKLKRKKSFRESIQRFTSMLPSSPPKESVNSKKKLAPKDFDDWSEDEDEDPRFSYGALSRIQYIKKQIQLGTNPEEVQRNSKDWYTINRRRCIDAQEHLNKHEFSQAWPLIQQASDDGFPGATFELAKQALKESQAYKAKLFLRKTCEQLRDKGHLLDNQYRDETLVKGIKNLIAQDSSLKDILQEFEKIPYFYTTQMSSNKLSASTLNIDLTKFADKSDEEDDDVFGQVLNKLYGK